MTFPVKITSSGIWVAIPVDWVILHWYACDADGWSGGRCRVTWLPNFLGWVVYHMLLPMVFRCARFVRESSAIISFYHIRSRERAKYEAVLQCPGLTGLQQGEHRRMQKEQLYDRSRMFWILILENRSQLKVTFFFCSKIINLSFNSLAYNKREHFAHC